MRLENTQLIECSKNISTELLNISYSTVYGMYNCILFVSFHQVGNVKNFDLHAAMEATVYTLVSFATGGTIAGNMDSPVDCASRPWIIAR